MPREKIIIAVCGLPDAGKSTFIANATKELVDMEVQPDALCVEQQTGKTIAASYIATWGKHWQRDGKSSDLVFIDCPGHIEFLPEIVAGLAAAHGYIIIHDATRREQSEAYANNIRDIASEVLHLTSLGEIFSHCNDTGTNCYNVGEDNRLPGIARRLVEQAMQGGPKKLVHPTAAWLGYIRQERAESATKVSHKISVVWTKDVTTADENKKLSIMFPDRTETVGIVRDICKFPDSVNQVKDKVAITKIQVDLSVRYLDPVRCLVIVDGLGTVGVGTVQTWHTEAI